MKETESKLYKRIKVRFRVGLESGWNCVNYFLMLNFHIPVAKATLRKALDKVKPEALSLGEAEVRPAERPIKSDLVRIVA